jgi:glyoxylase-like metal-dependent hydrolase (beta-lactamase superfamily II)
MSDKTYHLNIGDFRCTVFSDGYLQDKKEQFDINILYIEAGRHKVLLDNGFGTSSQGGTAGHLLKNMTAEGIKPEDIDTIIFDHGHIDHVCGTFDKNGTPVFPNARLVITKKEWAYIEAEPIDNKTQNNFHNPVRKYLVPLKERFKLVGDNYEVLPGIKFVPAHGHTPGNSMIDFSSKGQRLLSMGDVMHSIQDLTKPDQYAMYDTNPTEAIKNRSIIISKLIKDGTFVFVTHFGFPGLGHFRENKGVISWEPI